MRAATYLFVTLLWATSAVAQTLPKPSGRVTDLANVIDPGTEADIVARLDQLERQTSSEVAVVTVPSLDGVPVDDYAVRLFKEWGIGQAKQDNGVLVLVAPNEREMRIEVGYGLEGILPDGLAGQIIREQFIPRFRDNDYNGGIRDGVARVVEIVEKQQVLTAEELAKFNEIGRGRCSGVDHHSVHGAVRGDRLHDGRRRPAHEDRIPAAVWQLLRRHAAADGAGDSSRSVASVTLLPLAMGMTILGFRLGARESWRDAFRRQRRQRRRQRIVWRLGDGGRFELGIVIIFLRWVFKQFRGRILRRRRG